MFMCMPVFKFFTLQFIQFSATFSFVCIIFVATVQFHFVTLLCLSFDLPLTLTFFSYLVFHLFRTIYTAFNIDCSHSQKIKNRKIRQIFHTTTNITISFCCKLPLKCFVEVFNFQFLCFCGNSVFGAFCLSPFILSSPFALLFLMDNLSSQQLALDLLFYTLNVTL